MIIITNTKPTNSSQSRFQKKPFMTGNTSLKSSSRRKFHLHFLLFLSLHLFSVSVFLSVSLSSLAFSLVPFTSSGKSVLKLLIMAHPPLLKETNASLLTDEKTTKTLPQTKIKQQHSMRTSFFLWDNSNASELFLFYCEKRPSLEDRTVHLPRIRSTSVLVAAKRGLRRGTLALSAIKE